MLRLRAIINNNNYKKFSNKKIMLSSYSIIS